MMSLAGLMFEGFPSVMHLRLLMGAVADEFRQIAA